MPATEAALKPQAAGGPVRSAAVYYLLFIILGVVWLFVPQNLVVTGDTQATAHRVLASEALFRIAMVSGFMAAIFYVLLARALCRLLAAVDERQASLMVSFVLLSVPVLFVAVLCQLAGLTLIKGGPGLSGLASSQRDALALFFLKLSNTTFDVDLIFSGLWLLPLASLAVKSRFIPRIVGYLLIIAGCSYLVAFLTILLAPPFAGVLLTLTSIGYQGELSMAIWLLVAAATSLRSA